jgi:hypothetical protein
MKETAPLTCVWSKRGGKGEVVGDKERKWPLRLAFRAREGQGWWWIWEKKESAPLSRISSEGGGRDVVLVSGGGIGMYLKQIKHVNK